MEKKRIPWLAGLLSLCAFGLGQLYCGRIKRAIMQVVVFLIGYNSILYLFFVESLKPFNVIIPIFFIFGYYPYSIIDAFVLARGEKTITLKSYNKWYIYLIYPLIFITILAYTNFVSEKMKAYKIPSEAMENSLFVGDFFMADNTAYIDASPERGDIVVFFYPKDRVTKYVKRCIALPGDTIEIRDRVVFINGTHQEDPKTIKFTIKNIRPRRNGQDSPDNFGPHVIPEGHYFMMGDNRDNSSDSRFWGAVPEDLIIGEAKVIHWSKDWNRIGMTIK